MQSIIWTPQTLIDTPGVYAGISLNEYHSQICVGPSVSSTGLRHVLEVSGGSPAHFYCEWSGNPNRIEQPDKEHFALGRAVHHLVLGEAKFAKNFAIRPPQWDSWRTAAAREWRDQMQATGRGVLAEKDIEAIRGMAISLGKNDLVRQGLLSGAVERSLIWQDKETGLWVKARPDSIPTDSGDFADLKTTTSVLWHDLANTVREHGYHQQAALVREGARACAGLEMTSFTFVFVEKKPPYCVRLVHLKNEDLDIGARLNRAALNIIASCIKAKRWPGPGEGHIVNLDLGDWYRERANTELAAIKMESL